LKTHLKPFSHTLGPILFILADTTNLGLKFSIVDGKPRACAIGCTGAAKINDTRTKARGACKPCFDYYVSKMNNKFRARMIHSNNTDDVVTIINLPVITATQVLYILKPNRPETTTSDRIRLKGGDSAPILGRLFAKPYESEEGAPGAG